MVNIKKIFKRENIRLAVVGLTSSGKTYLLQDIVTSISRLGFQPQRLTKSPFSYVGSFIGDGKVGQTKRYAAQKVNHYVGRYDNGNKKFEIEFLDIPGESISDKAIKVFDAVAVSLYNQTNEIYLCETWKKGDTEIKILDFKIQKTGTTPRVETPSSFNLPETTNSGGVISDTNTTTANDTRKALERQGFKKNKEKKVSGKQVFEDFFDYHPETVMSAINASWEQLTPDKPDIIDENDENDEKDKKDKKKSFKEIFFGELYTRDFYYLMYCTRATDIIMCDKMTLPKDIDDKTELKSSFLGMTRKLLDLKASHELFNQDARWYMAFKGVDAVLKPNEIFSQWIENGKVDHIVYSVVTYAFCKKYLCELVEDPFDDDDYKLEEKNKLFNDVDSCANLLTSLSKDNRKKRFEYVYSILEKKEYENYIRNENEFNVLNDSGDNVKTLKSHIKARMEVFEKIEKSEKNQIYHKELQLPPHVFFIGTPIDKNYHIYGHKVDDATAFEKSVQAPENRLCFGTYQLVTDMLLRYKNIESDNDYGKLLKYFFGKDLDD